MRTLVTAGWNDVFASTIGEDGLKIGVDIFLKGQALGSFLHELIPRKFAKAYPSLWRPEVAVTDKDLVCIPDDKFSIELKTTSHPSNIPGNKSFAQSETPGKKLKDGYYLVLNYEKLEPGKLPGIKKIRFGWLDLSDWQGQSEDNGQGANVKALAKKHKLIDL